MLPRFCGFHALGTRARGVAVCWIFVGTTALKTRRASARGYHVMMLISCIRAHVVGRHGWPGTRLCAVVIEADPRLQPAGVPYTAERLQAIQDGLNDRPGNASASVHPRRIRATPIRLPPDMLTAARSRTRIYDSSCFLSLVKELLSGQGRRRPRSFRAFAGSSTQ